MTNYIMDLVSFLYKYNISVIEYYILMSVDDTPIELKKLAQYTMKSMRHDPYGKNFTLSEYINAIKLCLKTGLIKILTKEDCDYDSKRWLNVDSMYPQGEYREGFVDFSDIGAQIFYDIRDKLNIQLGFGGYFDNIVLHVMKNANILSIFATNKSNINKALEGLETTQSLIFRHGEKIITVGEPYQIKNWWANRFIELPSGWRVDITYTPQGR